MDMGTDEMGGGWGEDGDILGFVAPYPESGLTFPCDI